MSIVTKHTVPYSTHARVFRVRPLPTQSLQARGVETAPLLPWMHCWLRRCSWRLVWPMQKQRVWRCLPRHKRHLTNTLFGLLVSRRSTAFISSDFKGVGHAVTECVVHVRTVWALWSRNVTESWKVHVCRNKKSFNRILESIKPIIAKRSSLAIRLSEINAHLISQVRRRGTRTAFLS